MFVKVLGLILRIRGIKCFAGKWKVYILDWEVVFMFVIWGRYLYFIFRINFSFWRVEKGENWLGR